MKTGICQENKKAGGKERKERPREMVGILMNNLVTSKFVHNDTYSVGSSEILTLSSPSILTEFGFLPFSFLPVFKEESQFISTRMIKWRVPWGREFSKGLQNFSLTEIENPFSVVWEKCIVVNGDYFEK